MSKLHAEPTRAGGPGHGASAAAGTDHPAPAGMRGGPFSTQVVPGASWAGTTSGGPDGLLAADWPQHLGPTRDGHSPETGLARSWPKDGPVVAWKRDVGSGWSGVAVAGDRLMLFHRVGDDEVVECLDPATGKGRWTGKYH